MPFVLFEFFPRCGLKIRLKARVVASLKYRQRLNNQEYSTGNIQLYTFEAVQTTPELNIA